jgi:hypothetical protein
VVAAWRTLRPVGLQFPKADRAGIKNTVDREGVLCIPLVNIVEASERPGRKTDAIKGRTHVVKAYWRVRGRASM